MTTYCTVIGEETFCDIHGVPLGPFMYDKGYRFCSRCAKCFKIKEIQCPCCGTGLRQRPRGNRAKQRYIAELVRY